MKIAAGLLALVLSFSACGECGEAPQSAPQEGSGQTVSGGSTGGGGGDTAIPLNPRKKTDDPLAPPKQEPAAIKAAGDVRGVAQAAAAAPKAGETRKLAAVSDVLPSEFDRVVLKSKTPVLVVYVTSSCRPCAQVEFQLGTLASDYAGKVAFARLDLNQSGAYELLPAGLRRLPLPAFAFYQDGSPLNIRQGMPVAGDASTHLKNWLKRVIDGRDVRL